MRLIYGGSRAGLMGLVADAALEAGGEVTGVIPADLVTKEAAHRGLSDLRVVDSMHARKALMADLADAFVALPGGFGTFEETFETLTWTQLGVHAKPTGLVNVLGFFDDLAVFLDRGVDEGFIRKDDRALVHIEDNVMALLARLAAFRPPTAEKWVDRRSL